MRLSQAAGIIALSGERRLSAPQPSYDVDAVLARLRARGAELVGELERYEDIYRLC